MRFDLDSIERDALASLPGPTPIRRFTARGEDGRTEYEEWPSHVREIVLELVRRCRDAEIAATMLARTLEQAVEEEVRREVGGASRFDAAR